LSTEIKKEKDTSIQYLCLRNRTVTYFIHDHSQGFMVMQLSKIVSDPRQSLSSSRLFSPYPAWLCATKAPYGALVKYEELQ